MSLAGIFPVTHYSFDPNWVGRKRVGKGGSKGFRYDWFRCGCGGLFPLIWELFFRT